MFSTVMSAFLIMSLTSWSPRGDLRSIAMDFLLALNMWKYHGSVSGLPGCSRRPGSPVFGFSILTTSAPSQASASVQDVPASNWVKSTTRIPARHSNSWTFSFIADPSQLTAVIEGVKSLAIIRGTAFPTLPLQLLLQLVEEAPVGALSEDLLRGGLDETRLAKPERIEAHRVVGIVLFPLPIRHFLQGLDSVLQAVHVALVHQETGHPLRFERTDVGGLQDGAQRALGGHRVLADELLVADHHATEVLGPRPVGRGIEEHVADLLGARVLSQGRKTNKSVDRSGGQESLPFGRRMDRPGDVLVGIESDVGRHGRDEYVGACAERRNGYLLPLQVSDGPDTFLSEYFNAADMNTGQKDDRLLGVDPENHRRTEEHRDIGLARPQCGLGRPQTPFHVLDIAEALALE